MNDIPIFDSLTHPTFNGDWILPKYSSGIASIEKLIEDMDKSNISHAIACGMKDIGGYDSIEYSKLISKHSDRLFAVAFCDFEGIHNVKKYLVEIKKLGYIGIKIHPRISAITLKDSLVNEVIKYCKELDLIVFLCTYFYSTAISSSENNPESLVKLLAKTYPAKIVLVHSGAVRLLEFMEIARAFDNVLLDLSLTFLKYDGSSIDTDIKFMFEKFDRRICIGTDFPEFNHYQLRQKFNSFAKNLPNEKSINIANKNLLNYLKIK